MISIRTSLIRSAKKNSYVTKLIAKRILRGISIKDAMWISPTRLLVVSVNDEEYVIEIVKMGKYKTHVKVLKNFITL